jgi:hypothetical protein
MNPCYQTSGEMSILKSIWGINTSVMNNTFEFYVDLYLDYYRNVDQMAFDKKRKYLLGLFKVLKRS